MRIDYASNDGQVLGVAVPRPALYTATMSGFADREQTALVMALDGGHGGVDRRQHHSAAPRRDA